MAKTIYRNWLFWGLLLVYTIGCTPQKQRASVVTITGSQIPVKVIRVIDGDTYVADVELPLSVILQKQRIRCLDYDAYELSTPKGKEAKLELEKLLTDAHVYIILYGVERDNFGRILGKTFSVKGQDTIDIEQWMKEHGFHENNRR